VPALPKRRQSDLVATRCLVVARTRPVLVNFTSTYIDLQPCVTNWMRKRCRHDHVRMAPGVRLCGAESVWSAASDRGRVRRPAMTEDPASAAPPTAQSVVPPKRQLRTRGPGHGKTPKLAPLCCAVLVERPPSRPPGSAKQTVDGGAEPTTTLILFSSSSSTPLHTPPPFPCAYRPLLLPAGYLRKRNENYVPFRDKIDGDADRCLDDETFSSPTKAHTDFFFPSSRPEQSS
jgi:hypothetical protein